MSIPWGPVAVALLGAAVLSGVVYASVRLVLSRRRSRPSTLVSIAEYVLVGWSLMFVFVTQVLAFGNSMGAGLNLQPFGAFYDAWNYGLVNAGTLPQVALNIVITIPLGVLLPLVFPRRFAGFLRVGIAGLAVSLVTEAVQLVTGRNADIDDVIANTLGVLVGYSVVRLVRAALSRTARRPVGSLVAAALVIVLAVAPFIAVWAMDARDPAGHLYYGHLRPTSVDVSGIQLSSAEATGTVYRYVEQESAHELLARLSKITGFADCTEGSADGASGECLGEPDERLFVFPYGRWSVSYAYAVPLDDLDPALVPDEDASIVLAKNAMRQLGIEPGTLVYEGLWDWQDDLRHVQFVAEPGSGSTVIWGTVRVDIGENGRILGVDDRRGTFERVGDVTTISSQAALQLAQDVGVDQFDGTAVISGITKSFAFNQETGYLVPSWQFTGEFQGIEWTPNMDARKH